jgi:hypothetical protein
MLMSPHKGAIDIMNFPIQALLTIRLTLQRVQYPLPNPGFLPAIETAGNRCPFPIAFRPIAPRCSGSINPPHSVDNGPMIVVGMSGMRFLRREDTHHKRPWLVA